MFAQKDCPKANVERFGFGCRLRENNCCGRISWQLQETEWVFSLPLRTTASSAMQAEVLPTSCSRDKALGWAKLCRPPQPCNVSARSRDRCAPAFS